LLRRTTVLPVESGVSQRRALMDTFFLSHGLLIPDALIAATALEHGLTLYTRNVRDFQMVPSLVVKQPY
jgi:predicted nucleic acid-binding protein